MLSFAIINNFFVVVVVVVFVLFLTLYVFGSSCFVFGHLNASTEKKTALHSFIFMPLLR